MEVYVYFPFLVFFDDLYQYNVDVSEDAFSSIVKVLYVFTKTAASIKGIARHSYILSAIAKRMGTLKKESHLLATLKLVVKLFYVSEEASAVVFDQMEDVVHTVVEILKNNDSNKVKKYCIFALCNVVANGDTYLQLLLQEGFLSYMLASF